MSNDGYHIPVLLQASVDGLNINPNGTYVDATFGGGGHSREILKRLDKGKLYAFDQDPDAAANTPNDGRFTLIPQNFSNALRFLRLEGVRKIDGLLADFGVSSHQFDQEERGFSIRGNASLDMRMNQRSDLTAAKILNEYPAQEIYLILKNYGEVDKAYYISKRIESFRSTHTINNTDDLKLALQPFMPRGKENKFLAQVFQALRIEVNQEMEALKALLTQSIKLIKPGGRLVCISYHSLEDRLVKHMMKMGKFEGTLEKDFFGNPLKPFATIQTKAIIPDEDEIKSNPRARSAKLRIAERTTWEIE